MLTDQQLDIIAQSRPASPYDVRRLIADYKRVRAMAAENERLRDIIACMEAEKAGGTGDIETLFAELGVPPTEAEAALDQAMLPELRRLQAEAEAMQALSPTNRDAGAGEGGGEE